MNNLKHNFNERPQFKNLPPEFRNQLKEFKRAGYITDGILPEIETSLLDAINDQEISSGYSPIDSFRICPDVKELIVWIGVHFSIYIKIETPESLFGEILSKGIRLISFDDYNRHDLVWEHDIENYIKSHKHIINISIIEDYKKILPLIIDFKKGMHQKTGQLPYLGERKDNGDFLLLDKKILRPDYNRIKANPTISLKNCICILLGIDDLSLIVSRKDHLDLITEEQTRYLWEDDFVVLPHVDSGDPYKDIVTTMKYREGWRDIISFVENFISEIISESEEGNIKRVNHNALTGYHSISLRDIDEETHNCNFDTLDFLSWMQENGYPIPEELAIENNAHGAPAWADRPNQNSDNKNLEKVLDETLIKVIPDIDRFYEAFKKVLKHHHYDEEQDYIQYAQETFSDIQHDLETLLKQDIKGVFDKKMDPQDQFRVKGKLAKNMVIRLKPDLKKLAANSQKLIVRINNLKKSLESHSIVTT